MSLGKILVDGRKLHPKIGKKVPTDDLRFTNFNSTYDVKFFFSVKNYFCNST